MSNLSRTNVPTEAEIRSAAQRLGIADENGNYKQRDRARIAATIQKAAQDQAAENDPATGNTAVMLARFRDELLAAGFAHDPVNPEIYHEPRLGGVGEEVLIEAARYLLKTAGLQLKSDEEEPTP
ncbi:hypothetical protein BJY24_004146 [Nocardia transvalensis]|uniref:Uncharacterized protein n=1 Tax=Nocardia transvalensis TaxID=37333 RepID=A0A7W9PFK8_9NOCA|nr:hypothetical protein [Nocardia transvalensis]MBB5915279.1 hypothetical protein [Nocardia transvalensis]